MAFSEGNWYVVYTYPNLEKRISILLTKRDITTYLPLQKVYHQWSDRIKELEVPLFPNYVFVHINDRERTKVLSINGILRFISFEGKLAVIPDNEIQLIRKLEHTNVEVESDLVKGDRVKIIRGSFAGLEGILINKIGKRRVVLRLNTLKQSLSLEININFLDKIEPTSSLYYNSKPTTINTFNPYF